MSTFFQALAASNLERVVSPTQMDTEYILESLEQASGMLRNLSVQYNLEFDDLHQESFIVCQQIMSDPTKPHHRAYLQGAIRMHVFDIVRKRKTAASLDAPLSDESDMTLIDLLVEPTKPQPTRRDYYRKRALLKALRRLPEYQQRAIQILCQIDALKIATHKTVARATSMTYRSAAYKVLRQDTRLNKAIMGTWK